MLDAVIAYLICPVCGAPVRQAGGAVRCQAGHSFDVAKPGYVSLRTGARDPGTGDTAAMVAARERFLGAGHYASLAAAVAGLAAAASGLAAAASGPAAVASGLVAAASGPAAVASGPAAAVAGAPQPPGCVVDVGAGTGYYLAAVLERLPGRAGVALDVSGHALRRAARAHARIGAVGCDAWRGLPVAGGAAALVLSIFAPRNAAEARRILHPDGRLLVVTPTARHLAELAGPLGLIGIDQHKDERLGQRLADGFSRTERHGHTAGLELDHQAVSDLVQMGPSAWHVDAKTLAAAIGALPEPAAVTLDVTLSVYRPRPAATALPG